MTCRPHTIPETLSHVGYIVFLSAFGALAAYSSIFALPNINRFEDVVSIAITLLLTVMVFSVDYFECRAMGARLYMDEEGIGVKRFGKMKVFKKWSEIQEVGVGKVQTVFGMRKRVYFCDRALTEEEKADLVTLKRHTVLFSYIPQQWYTTMCKRLTVPIAQDIADKFVKK